MKRFVFGDGALGQWFVATALVVGSLSSSAISVSNAGNSEQGVPTAPSVSGAAALYSPGIADIVKLVEAKVDPAVIKAYIKSSSAAYRPSAAEIIALKEKGVSADILTAILERGGEIRAAKAGQAMALSPAQPAQSAAPTYDYGSAPAAPAYYYPDYSYSYPDYSYYAYGYPRYDYSYWWWNYGYPWLGFWPSFTFGSFPYYHHRYHGFYPYHHFGWPHSGWSSFGGHQWRPHGFQNSPGFPHSRSFASGNGGLHSFGTPMGGAFGRGTSFGSRGAFASRPMMSMASSGFRSGPAFGGGRGSFGGGHSMGRRR